MSNVVSFPQAKTVEAIIREGFRTGASSPKVATRVMEAKPGMIRRTAVAVARTEMTRLAAQSAEARYGAFQ